MIEKVLDNGIPDLCPHPKTAETAAPGNCSEAGWLWSKGAGERSVRSRPLTDAQVLALSLSSDPYPHMASLLCPLAILVHLGRPD